MWLYVRGVPKYDLLFIKLLVLSRNDKDRDTRGLHRGMIQTITDATLNLHGI